MSDVITLARSARERLSAALNSLQAPGVPPGLMAVAKPVAEAMSLMHQVEAAPGSVAAFAPPALKAVRQALAGLQTADGTHPCVAPTAEAVASSLAAVHSLSTAGSQGAAQPNPQPLGQTAPLASPATTARSANPGAQASAAPRQYSAPAAQPAPILSSQPAPRQYSAPAAQPAPQPVAVQHAAQPLAAQHAPRQYSAPAPQAAPAPAAAPQYSPAAAIQSAPVPIAAAPGQPLEVHPLDVGDSGRIEAALGAHSMTNFYKGLSGNDVIDSGGIFVATYNIPALGETLQLRISMPGGYEFDAVGIVRWSRDSPQSASTVPDAPPGFGAQFTQITQEARQLVYRYVRNREPLFHDDL